MPNDIPITQHEIDGVNEALADIVRDLDPLADEALRLLRQPRNVVLYGPPGTGKTRAALQIQEAWRTQHGDSSTILTTFHPSYSYEDFIEGWRPDPAASGGFDLKDGVFMRAVDLASEAGTPTLLIIDEINRGDVARILGEVITFIEHDKRGLRFTTAQRRDVERTVPPNLFILGTMNTADKSINLLDVALRRRFAFVSCPPQPAVLSSSSELQAVVGGIALADLLVEINRRLQQHDIEVDRQIGHALLAISLHSPDPEQELVDRLRYDVLPLVEEYLYADREAVREVLPDFFDEDGRPVPPTIAAIAKLAAQAAIDAGDETPQSDDNDMDDPDEGDGATDGPGSQVEDPNADGD
jgi:5-methylcytosine-specific restriction protein B